MTLWSTPRQSADAVRADQVPRASVPPAVEGDEPHRWTDHLWGIGPFLVVLGLAFHVSPDDSLITARYAFNALDGHGLAFNPGNPVEGFSSPLHLALTVLLAALPGGYFLLKMKLLSVLFGILTLVASAKLVRVLPLPRWARLFALAAVGSSWNLAISAVNGLETSLVVFLTTLLVALLAAEYAGPRSLWTGLVAAALSVTRPESILIVALLAVAAATGTGRLPDRVPWAVGPAVAVVALVTARLAYFGELVPNTYFAKEADTAQNVLSALRYIRKTEPVWDTLGRPGANVSLLLQVALLAVAVAVSWRAGRFALLAVAAVAVGQIAFILKSGGDWMRGGRFVVPMIPSLTVLLTVGLVGAVTWAVHRRRRVLGGVLVAATFASLAWPVTSSFSPLWRTASFTDRALVESGNSDFDGTFSRLWVMTPDLVSCLAPGSSVAYTEMGYFGFVNRRLDVVDMRGLTDREVARSADPGTRHFYGIVDDRWFDGASPVGRVLLERRPEMILNFDTPAQEAPLGGAYRLDRTVEWGDVLHPLGVYVRSDFTCR